MSRGMVVVGGGMAAEKTTGAVWHACGEGGEWSFLDQVILHFFQVRKNGSKALL